MFFKKKKQSIDDLILVFNTVNTKIGNNDDISNNLKIKGKYYKLIPSFYSDHFTSDNNIALYFKIDYSKGINNPIDIDSLIDDTYNKILIQQSEIKTYYEIDIKELFKETKEYLVEFDFKSGCSDVKNIIHFHDNEKGINGYFVFYDLDFKSIDTEYLFENTLIQQLKSNALFNHSALKSKHKAK